MKKLYDLVVAKDRYTRSDGEEKTNWQNVGVIMEKDDGSRFILIERSINFAGFPNPENRSSILVSMFKPKAKDDQGASGGTAQAVTEKFTKNESDIPF